MTVSADTLRLLIEAGLSGDRLLAIVESIERDNAKTETKGAERTRRWRARRAEAAAADVGDVSRGVTRDVTRDATCDVAGDVSGDRHGGDVVPLTLPLPPQTPLTPTHTPPESSTRAKAPSRLAKSNGFARFWEAYPNKVGKAAAEKSYDRAVAKIGGDDPAAVILAGLDRAKLSRKWREGYIPNPTTWLNQGRWEDQPAEQAPDHERTRPHHANDHDGRADGRALWGEALAISRGGRSG